MGECILAGHPQGGKIGYGTYKGNNTTPRTISLGVTPKWVLVFDTLGQTTIASGSSNIGVGGLAIEGQPVSSRTIGYNSLEIVSGGFKVFWDSHGEETNSSQRSYNYIYGT